MLVSIPLSAGLGFHCIMFTAIRQFMAGLNPFIGRAWFSQVVKSMKDIGDLASQSLYRQGLVFTQNQETRMVAVG